MSVPVAYATIIIVWSTTPLGISWSNESISPLAAVAMRMAIAALVGMGVLRVLGIPLFWTREALKSYTVSLLGIYLALTLTYIAALHVPSGLISVIYALSPLVSTLLATFLLGRGDFTISRLLSFLISFFGLVTIFLDDWVIEGKGLFGLSLLLLAVFLYSLSGVLVQKVRLDAHPLSTTVGSLIVAMPFFIGTWALIDGNLPNIDVASKSIWAILYLALFGSLIGFACYFFIVKELGATAVAMVTLITPVVALAMGHTLNSEPITEKMVIGTGMVITGLLFYYSNGIFLKYRTKTQSL